MDIPTLLLNDRYNDRYFDAVDALSEAKQIHIGNARIVERVNAAFAAVNTIHPAIKCRAYPPRTGERSSPLQHIRAPACRGELRSLSGVEMCSPAKDTNQKKVFRIGETGFGAGRLLVALLDSLDAGLTRNAAGRVAVDYNTVEMHPVSAERMERMLSIFEDRAARHIRAVVDAYSRLDVAAPGFHTAAIPGDRWVVNLNLYVGEALEMVESLPAPCAAWFLDGHAPKKNPDIWRPELMAAVGRKTEPGGTATAFTVAGHVRRALSAAGFSVEKVEGCGGKKEALLAAFL